MLYARSERYADQHKFAISRVKCVAIFGGNRKSKSILLHSSTNFISFPFLAYYIQLNNGSVVEYNNAPFNISSKSIKDVSDFIEETEKQSLAESRRGENLHFNWKVPVQAIRDSTAKYAEQYPSRSFPPASFWLLSEQPWTGGFELESNLMKRAISFE